MNQEDPLLEKISRLFQQQDFHQASGLLAQRASNKDPFQESEIRRIEGWVELARGETERAYQLFWSCSGRDGARAGIMLLTILAGQIKTAIDHWCRYLSGLTTPPIRLPDSFWHANPATKAALNLLSNYSFPERSPLLGASLFYQALLHRTLDENSKAFLALAKAVDFFPMASLLRDTWLEEFACLPAPPESRADSHELATEASEGHRAEDLLEPNEPRSHHPGRVETLINREQVLSRAQEILFYPSPRTLENWVDQALEEQRWWDALEYLRRLLFLEPESTSGLERRWRLLWKLERVEEARADLYHLIDLYQNQGQSTDSLAAAKVAVEMFPRQEQALLKLCFLLARLEDSLTLAEYGVRLLDLCQSEGQLDRRESYQRWLLRQNLSLDDRYRIQNM